VSFEGAMLVDRAAYSRARAELGASFVRLLGYLREDGVKSVSAIEAAMRAENAAAMIIPAHTLKGEARQFGALPLAELAEKIEDHARACVERRDTPNGSRARWNCWNAKPIRSRNAVPHRRSGAALDAFLECDPRQSELIGAPAQAGALAIIGLRLAPLRPSPKQERPR
jgi:histidine phosphotransfer protein HptB